MRTRFDAAPSSADVTACRSILRRGSKSFSAAALLLPGRLRDPVSVFYAFCRVADDAVDEAVEPVRALDGLRARLDRIYAGVPDDDPVDRAFARVVEVHALPRTILEALLEGFAWDVEGRRYATVADLRGYCARVAATVGVAMTLLMGERRERVLRRACDLGVAMQLTNIARDVGEDARNGRVYLPTDWLREVGIGPEELAARPRYTPALGFLVRRLLGEADPLYRRADHGVQLLPRDCRIAIRAARLIYADIGRAIAVGGYDTVSRRAHTSAPRKAWLLARATRAAVTHTATPSAAPALPEVAFLLEGPWDGPC